MLEHYFIKPSTLDRIRANVAGAYIDLDACMPPTSSAARPNVAGWHKDQDLMKWLQTL